jgi:hypothetical protein
VHGARSVDGDLEPFCAGVCVGREGRGVEGHGWRGGGGWCGVDWGGGLGAG